MPYLVGTDEAGYGPNLGPLVITATVWQVDCTPWDCDLYGLLAPAVSAEPAKGGCETITLADSKSLYSPQIGLAALEQNLIAVLRWAGLPTTCARTLFQHLAPDAWEDLIAEPWETEIDLELPVAGDPDWIGPRCKQLKQTAEAACVELKTVRSRVVVPNRFNQLVERAGNKATALSEQTLELVAELIEPLEGPVLILCDKHGGRNFYAGLLQQLVCQTLLQVREESRARSVYTWGSKQARREIRFQSAGERFLPTALASMVSKYLRELAMSAFNRFWCARVPELRPTAGYPGDARRFKTQIAEVQAALGIADEFLWRAR
jgi:ribonuclease HII